MISTELYFAVDHEDKLRAVAARKLELIYQAETLNSDIAQQRHDVLVDAEAELRTFMSNLASTLDAAAHRTAALDLEMREAGLTAGELLQFVDALASGDCLARTLLLRVAAAPHLSDNGTSCRTPSGSAGQARPHFGSLDGVERTMESCEGARSVIEAGCRTPGPRMAVRPSACEGVWRHRTCPRAGPRHPNWRTSSPSAWTGGWPGTRRPLAPVTRYADDLTISGSDLNVRRLSMSGNAESWRPRPGLSRRRVLP